MTVISSCKTYMTNVVIKKKKIILATWSDHCKLLRKLSSLLSNVIYYDICTYLLNIEISSVFFFFSSINSFFIISNFYHMKPDTRRIMLKHLINLIKVFLSRIQNDYFSISQRILFIHRTRLPSNLLYCHISHYEKWSLLVKRALFIRRRE